MKSYYEILGVSPTASGQEIRRAYRILARRYHPDLNPGNKKSEDTFKDISKAYSTLSDEAEREKYDFQTGPKPRSTARPKQSPKPKAQDESRSINFDFQGLRKKTSEWIKQKTKLFSKSKAKNKNSTTSSSGPSVKSVSVIEVSVSLADAIKGVKKIIELPEPTGTRKLSVTLPAGVRNGSVVRLHGNSKNGDELVVVVRVAPHNFLSIQNRGLVYEIPITIIEALQGAIFTIPTLDQDYTVKVPAGTSSGDELRVTGMGIPYSDGTKGDLFLRFMIVTPSVPTAIGLNEIAEALRGYYQGVEIRSKLPRPLLSNQ